MHRIWPLLAAIAFVAMPMMGASVVTVVTQTVRSTRCAPDSDSQKSTFANTDPEVYVFVYFADALVGDQLIIQFLRPDGTVQSVDTFDVPDAGDWCFNGHMFLAGTDAENYPGIWTAKGDLSGTPLFTISFTVTGPGQVPQRPMIADGGMVNAASYKPAALDSGALARGSYFSIFGTDLGPADSQAQMSYPLSTTLGGVSVHVQNNAGGASAYVVFVSPTQINGILPSNAPTGDVQVTVTHFNCLFDVKVFDIGIIFNLGCCQHLKTKD